MFFLGTTRFQLAQDNAGALVQLLELPAWKVRDCGLESHSGIHVSKEENVSSPLTRKESILWGASVTEM